MSYIIPDELLQPFSFLHTAHRSMAVYLMHIPITLKVIDVDPNGPNSFKAQTYGRVIEFAKWFLPTIPDYEEQALVLTHEILHQMCQHCTLMHKWSRAGSITGRWSDKHEPVTRPFDMGVAQWALDYIVNDAGYRMGLPLPKDALHRPAIGTWLDLEADVYVRLYDMMFQQSTPEPDPRTQTQKDHDNQQKDNSSAGGSDPTTNVGSLQRFNSSADPGNSCPDTSKPGAGAYDVIPSDPTDERGDNDVRQRAAIRKAMAELNPDKTRGIWPGEIEKLIDKLLPQKMDWRDVLRPRYRHYMPGPKPTWSSFDRRAFPHSILLPGRVAKRAGTVALVLDTSGSIGRREYEHFINHQIGLFEQTMPRTLYVLETDTQVRRDTLIKYPSQLKEYTKPIMSSKKGLIGGGGTNMPAAHAWMRSNNIQPDITVFFTDGYTPFPADLGTSREVIWVMTTDKVAPTEAGRTVRMWMD